MPRYIDADVLLAKCKAIISDHIIDKWNEKAAPASWAHAYLDFIDDIENVPTADVEPVKHWISVKERLPENDTSVLICACGHRVTAYYNHLKKAFILTEDENLYYETAAVSHWMPLPEPPKGE